MSNDVADFGFENDGRVHCTSLCRDGIAIRGDQKDDAFLQFNLIDDNES